MHWIPWIFVAAFGVVIAVNAIMIYFALSTFTGVAVETPYQRGLEYNKVLAAQAKQDSLGWAFEAAWRTNGDDPRQGEIRLRVSGGDGRGISGLAIDGTAHRPVEKRIPIELAFVAIGDGNYAAPVRFEAQGNWDLRLEARKGDERSIVIKRLFVP